MRWSNLADYACLLAVLAVMWAWAGMPVSAAPRPDPPLAGLLQRIEKARDRTHTCERQLGLDRTPVSTRKVGSRAYGLYVLALWRGRAEAMCGMARVLSTPGLFRQVINPCLGEIVDRETGGTWNHTVYNRQGSGAYGLPQALPGSKMASAGADWRTNPLTQLRWMAGYVNARYGGPCGALAHHNANGWY